MSNPTTEAVELEQLRADFPAWLFNHNPVAGRWQAGRGMLNPRGCVTALAANSADRLRRQLRAILQVESDLALQDLADELRSGPGTVTLFGGTLVLEQGKRRTRVVMCVGSEFVWSETGKTIASIHEVERAVELVRETLEEVLS